MSKTFNARIKHKRDTSANWTAQDPVLLNGELIVVDTASGEMRFKIGDGTKRYSQLPFQDEILRNSKADLEAGVYTATASSTDGVSYTATVTGIDSLSAGSSFIMIPNKTSASTTPTFFIKAGYKFNGWYSDSEYQQLISINNPASIITPINPNTSGDVNNYPIENSYTLYAKAESTTTSTTGIYLKCNDSWIKAKSVFKKTNGAWVEQEDLSAIFSGESSGTASNYVYVGSV